uniref:Myb/SANT-like domain-containing protein n=1 Tax=Ananas comosus var. bracteatus TaxID=296719 RepID=A0A6V7NII5_ANACO|nr:unnamed protein product [Ananas comosus var. bracteatus]
MNHDTQVGTAFPPRVGTSCSNPCSHSGTDGILGNLLIAILFVLPSSTPPPFPVSFLFLFSPILRTHHFRRLPIFENLLLRRRGPLNLFATHPDLVRSESYGWSSPTLDLRKSCRRLIPILYRGHRRKPPCPLVSFVFAAAASSRSSTEGIEGNPRSRSEDLLSPPPHPKASFNPRGKPYAGCDLCPPVLAVLCALCAGCDLCPSNLSKNQTKNRLKVLKRLYLTYHTLANKSGSGWDYVNNISTAGDPSDWDAVVAEISAYAKCRDKPFSVYKDIEFLSSTTTATGRFGIQISLNFLPPRFEPGSSNSPMPENVHGNNISRSPSPPLVQPNVGGSASGSGHSPAGKRPRSPQASLPPKKQPSSSAGQREKSDITNEAIVEFVEIGKQKLAFVKHMYQQDSSNQANIPSIEECMERVYNLPGITDEQALAAGEALLNDKHRRLFMTMKDRLAIRWIERQVAVQDVLYKQNFLGF